MQPNLGVVRVDANRSFVIADVPGLIEGAADGAGLGVRFLKHLTRTSLLLHMVDLAPLDGVTDPVQEAEAIVNELRKHDEALYEKTRWLVLNKVDMLENPEQVAADFVKAFAWDGPVFAISAINGNGCKQLTYAIMEHMEAMQLQEEALKNSDEQITPTQQ